MLGGELGEHGWRIGARGGAEVAVPQLARAGEEEVAPHAVLAAVGELLQRVGLQLARARVGRIREDRVVEQRCCPAVVALLERGPRQLDDPVDAAERRHIPLRLLRGGVRPQPRGVAVEPAHVALVDGLHVVADRPVVAAGVPRRLEGRRQLDHLGDLCAREALVEHPHGLVVQVRVDVALLFEVGDSPLGAPRRPVVRGEDHVGLASVACDRLGEVSRPAVRVAHERAAEREDVVQRVARILGHAQRPELRGVEVHLGGRLGPGRHLELDLDAVHDVRLARLADVEGRHDESDLPGRRRLAEAGPHLPERAALKRCAVHVPGAATHGGAGEDVLRDGVRDETLGRDDLHTARIHVGLGGDAEDATEVVGVAVRVDDGDDRPVPAVFAIEAERGGGRLGGDERIDDDDAAVALDERDVGEVESPHLVDAFDDLEQTLSVDKERLPPQARVDRVRGVALRNAYDSPSHTVPPDALRTMAGSRAAMNPRRASSKS